MAPRSTSSSERPREGTTQWIIAVCTIVLALVGVVTLVIAFAGPGGAPPDATDGADQAAAGATPRETGASDSARDAHRNDGAIARDPAASTAPSDTEPPASARVTLTGHDAADVEGFPLVVSASFDRIGGEPVGTLSVVETVSGSRSRRALHHPDPIEITVGGVVHTVAVLAVDWERRRVELLVTAVSSPALEETP